MLQHFTPWCVRISSSASYLYALAVAISPNCDSIGSCGRVAVYLIDRRTHTITTYSAGRRALAAPGRLVAKEDDRHTNHILVDESWSNHSVVKVKTKKYFSSVKGFRPHYKRIMRIVRIRARCAGRPFQLPNSYPQPKISTRPDPRVYPYR